MKKLLCFSFTFMLTLLFLVHPTFAAANQADWQYVQKKLQLLQGDWYNDDGELIVSIKDNYINGCQVLSASQFAGGSNFAAGTFYIKESTGTRGLKIMFQIFNKPSDYIIVDDNVMLHKATDYYYESVGGVHIGMSASNAEKILGTPSRQKTYSKGSYTWYYDSKGIEVGFSGHCVSSIKILKSCKLRLAKSGLNCSDTPQAYIKFYNWQPRSNGKFYYEESPNEIGYGEYIWLGKNMQDVTLTVHWN